MDEMTTVAPPVDDEDVIVGPDISHLITEDDTPVDNIFSERQMALLRTALYDSWPGPGEGRPFVAMANVGLFAVAEQTTLVPDLLLSLDVRAPDNPFPKINRSYFVWNYGKPPDVVIEIVSNNKGGELGNKLLDYARLGVGYYVVYDPEGHISEAPLRVFTRQALRFVETTDHWLHGVGLGLTLWEGEYEDVRGVWLRWCNQDGSLLHTGQENAAIVHARAEQESRRADEEHIRAEQERQRADEERARAEKLAARLRALGIDPEA